MAASSGGGFVMTRAHVYELGIKAYLAGNMLTGCPYDLAICSDAYSAWKDGWLDASRARSRRHARLIAARRHAKTSPPPIAWPKMVPGRNGVL